MIQYKCRSCGGEMELESSGSFVCPYCGSKSFMTDADFRGNEEFRKKMLAYMKAESENKELDYASDVLWRANDIARFTMMNGKQLNIQYMHQYSLARCECYLAKENVVYVFSSKQEANRYLAGLRQLVFPEADNKLDRCFPKLKMEVGLKDGQEVLVFQRRPNFYPAKMFAPWPSEHLAWVISRMENICCALQYSEIEHGGICPESIWIDPVTHEGMLYGDWRNARPARGKQDLTDLRKTAAALAMNAADPKELYAFLNTAPAADAFSDFAAWDQVIEKAFGGHKFIKMKRG